MVMDIKPPRSILDVGAGLGRIMAQLEPYFSSGDLIEPDQKRRNELTALTTLLDPGSRRFSIYAALEELGQSKKYDVILLSHVIQHICVGEVQGMLTQLAQRLHEGGMLYMATCLSPTQEHEYTVTQFDRNGGFEEVAISDTDFNSLAAVPEERKLPVHFFPIGALSAMVESAGLAVFEVRLFHPIQNLSAQRTRFRDVAMVAKYI
jgi:protein-L-isoaspartate O-methyltransferase